MVAAVFEFGGVAYRRDAHHHVRKGGNGTRDGVGAGIEGKGHWRCVGDCDRSELSTNTTCFGDVHRTEYSNNQASKLGRLRTVPYDPRLRSLWFPSFNGYTLLHSSVAPSQRSRRSVAFVLAVPVHSFVSLPTSIE